MKTATLFYRSLMLFCLLSLGIPLAHAQEKDDPTPTTVTLDLSARRFTNRLPFDESFRVTGKVPDGINLIKLKYNDLESGTTNTVDAGCWPYPRQTGVKLTNFLFLISPLDPDKRYEFHFELYKDPTEKTPPKIEKRFSIFIQSATRFPVDSVQINMKGDSTDNVVSPLNCLMNQDDLPDPTDTIRIVGIARSTFTQHFMTDFGFLGTGSSEKHTQYRGLYSSAHFYLAPINNKADLIEYGFLPGLRRRISGFVGLAFEEWSSDTAVPIENLTDIGTPVVGIGLRGVFYWGPIASLLGPRHRYMYRTLAQPFRLNTGILIFEQTAANPLVNTKNTKRDWFISLSVDLNFINIVGPLSALFK